MKEKHLGKAFCSIDPITGAALIGGGLSAGGSIFSGIFGSSAAKKQAAAIERAANIARQTALDLDAKARADVAPFRQYGITAGDTLLGMLTGSQDVTGALQESPLFQFQEELGTRNINRQLSARGLYNSGAGLETLAMFTKGLVAEEGQRFYDRLFNLTSLGANAAGRMATNTAQTGQSISNMQAQMGLAQAGAIGQQYQAIGGAIGGTLSGFGRDVVAYPGYAASTNYLNSLAGMTTGAPPGAPTGLQVTSLHG